MTDSPAATAFLRPDDRVSDFGRTKFQIEMLMARMATSMPVKVVSCSNAGGLAATGTVVLQPLLNQVDAAGVPTPHGQLHGVPYFRMQGGANAFVCDPVAGDIGAAIFSSRDMTTIRRNFAQGNPASPRRFSMADGMYLPALFSQPPTQYVIINSDGVKIVSLSDIVLSAQGDIDLMATGNVAITSGGMLTHNGHNVGATHRHTGVQTGSGESGPPQ